MVNYFYLDLIGSILSSYISDSPITVSIILTAVLSLSKPIGGLTFGILFWTISRKLGYERNIMAVMTIAGLGIFLIFATNQGFSLTLTPFPPFGLATITVLVLGSYLTLIGIYNSALLVKSNSEIRTLIYKHALEIKLLGLIGHAEVEKEINITVDKILKEKGILEHESERSFDLDEDQLKKHLDLVLRETRKNES
jgi:hypothetical protein